MDDADLKNLSVNQKGLVPQFNKDVLNYSLVVASSVLSLKVSGTTSDKGASISLKSDKTGWADEGELKLDEGDNIITVEVASEDGTIKKYSICCSKMSASDATLKNLKSTNNIIPDFKTNVFEYEVVVDYKQLEYKFSYEVFDPLCTVKVTSNNKTVEYDETEGTFIKRLNYGFTTILINVKSPDNSNTQNYSILIIKKTIPRLCTFVNAKDQINFEDPISLSPIHCSFKINRTGYSLEFIKFFQKISSSDPLNEISLSTEENQNASKLVLFNHIAFEESLSNSIVHAPSIDGSFSNETKLENISEQIEKLNSEDIPKNNLCDHIETKSIQTIENLAKYQSHPWEKNFQVIYNETSPQKLKDISETHFKKYLELIENIDIEKLKKLETIIDQENEDSPIYALNMSIFCISTSLKYDSSSIESNIKLAMLLEEKNLFENIYGYQIKDEIIDTLGLQNQVAAESSKEEDISAICVLRNFGSNPSNTDILKALDQEYHYCLETGQNHKADQVQGLYLFKSKKISESSKMNDSQEDQVEKDLLKKSNQKYIDAMSLVLDQKKTNFTLNLYIGRSYMMIGEYDKSLSYLKTCLIWADENNQTLARFYFAYSMCKLPSLINESNVETIVFYIKSGLQLYLIKNSTHNDKENKSYAEDHFSIFNTIFLEAFIHLGKLISDFILKQESISSENAYRFSAWLCCKSLKELNDKTKVDQIYQQSKLLNDIIKILIEAHTKLITNDIIKLINDEYETERKLMSKKCIGLINLIRSSTHKNDENILRLHEKICHILVYSDPLDPYHLLLLACSKYDLYEFLFENKKQIYDSDFFNNILDECEILLTNGNLLQCNKDSDIVPTEITEMEWWKKLHESLSNQKKKRSEVTINTKPPVKEITDNKIKAKPALKTNNKADIKKNSKPTRTPVKGKESSSNNVVNAEDKNNQPKTTSAGNTDNEKLKKYVRNKAKFNSFIVHYQSQLYLARVYARMNNLEKATNNYEIVIQKERWNQDPYVELATLLIANGDPDGAVNVYASYPINENITPERQGSATNPPFKLRDLHNNNRKKKETSNFNDAFIYGELVRILMNQKKFDDDRLPKYLILWGKILGISVIEKDILTLNKSNKTNICKMVYAGVNNKSVDDPDLLQFFSFKGW